MTDEPNQWAAAAYPGDPLAHLRWWCDTSGRAAKELGEVLADRDTLRAEAAEQKAVNVKLAERLQACSEVLGRVAERGKLDLAAVIAAQAHKGGIVAVMGQWPGDETDAEIEAALRAEGGTVQGHTGEQG